MRLWMVMSAMVICAGACQKTIVEISKPMLVGTYDTNQSSPPEVQMELKLNPDDTFLLTCRNKGERTEGTWSVHAPYIVKLDAAPEAIHGGCAGFLPLSTTVTKTHGVVAIGIDSNYGIRVVKHGDQPD